MVGRMFFAEQWGKWQSEHMERGNGGEWGQMFEEWEISYWYSLQDQSLGMWQGVLLLIIVNQRGDWLGWPAGLLSWSSHKPNGKNKICETLMSFLTACIYNLKICRRWQFTRTQQASQELLVRKVWLVSDNNYLPLNVNEVWRWKCEVMRL